MSKATTSKVLVGLALLLSAWVGVISVGAPFSSVGPIEFTLFISAGIASLAAAVVAARRPRQPVVIAGAAALTLGHITLWLLVLAVALHERHIL